MKHAHSAEKGMPKFGNESQRDENRKKETVPHLSPAFFSELKLFFFLSAFLKVDGQNGIKLRYGCILHII